MQKKYKHSTKERLIEVMAAFLQERGYHASGISEILRASEVPSGSLYHFFPGGKAELALAAIEASTTEITKQLAPLLDKAENRQEALQLLGERLEQDLLASDFQNGCPVATTALELASDNPEIRAACSAAYKSWESLAQEFLEKSGLSQDEARTLASFLLASIEGALLLARTHRDVSYLKNCLHGLAKTIDAIETEA